MASASGQIAGQQAAALSGDEVLDLIGSGAQRRRSLAAKYSIDLDVEGSVWLPLVEWSCDRLYTAASDAEKQLVVSAMCHAFAETTTAQYTSVFRAFAAFCSEHDPELGCLPASKEAVHLFLASQVGSGLVNAKSLASMVSAINGVHNLCGLPAPVADDNQHRLFMAGLSRIIIPLQMQAERKPILSSMVVHALRHVVPLTGVPPATAVSDLLPVATVVLGVLTGLRGSALASLSKGDLSVTDGSVIVKATVLKRKLQPRLFADWNIPLDFQLSAGGVTGEVWQRIVRLLQLHLAFRATWSNADPLLAPVAATPTSVSESVVDAHVTSFVQRYGGGLPTDGYASHSLRIGAASAMIAAGISRNVIRIWFRWKSEGMIDLYARVVACDESVMALYGWLLQSGQSLTLYQ